MLSILVKWWIGLTFVILVIPVFILLKKLFNYIVWIFAGFYNKIEQKKNLENIKNEIIIKNKEINQNQENQENKENQYTKEETSNKEILNKKIEKIRFQAKSLKEKWDLEKYEKKIIEWLSYDGENLELLKMLGDLYFSTGNNKKALPILKKILEKDSNDHKTIWQVWQIYFEKEEFETAKLLINKAILLKNNNPKYYVSMAEIMYNTEELEEAINNMEKAVKLRPQNVNYLLAVASLYEEINNNNMAKRYYFKVLEIDQTHELAKEKVNEL